MDFALTEEQRDMAGAARHYLDDRYAVPRVGQLADAGGYDVSAWPELVRQGWLDPDLGLVELALLAEASGWALHPAPWWSSAGLALPVYRAAGRPLPGPATLATTAGCYAARESGGWVVDGRVAGAVDAEVATVVVVAAAAAAGTGLFGVAPRRPGVAVASRPGVDPFRRHVDLELTRAPGRLLVPPVQTGPLLAAIAYRSSVMLAAEAVGVADRALALATGHARTRVQFGRPIGAYQAVAHQLADAYADVELARSLVYRAACAPRDRPAEAAEALACAVHAGTGAAVSVCEVAIQVFGGTGVTWEFPLHRWYRRALWLQAYHAASQDPLDTVADVLFGAPAAGPT